CDRESELATPGLRVLAERRRPSRRLRQARLLGGPDGADGDVLVLEELEPVRERPRREQLLELGVAVGGAAEEVGATGELDQALPERRLERGDGQTASVRGLVDPVAGELARERAAERGELGGDGCKRDDDPLSAAR